MRSSDAAKALGSAILALALWAGPVRAAETPREASGLAGDYATLGKQSAVYGALTIAVMAGYWSAPPDATQWTDKPELSVRGFSRSWSKNVRSGPIWDGDMRIFNGYGHVHTGAALAVMCLQNGLSAVACTAYANLMSLAWEYGPEAVVEIPSWQDILMTGLVGARVGIQFETWRKSIAANGGALVGSKVLGWAATFVLDPWGVTTRGILGISAAEKARFAWQFPYDIGRRAVTYGVVMALP